MTPARNGHGQPARFRVAIVSPTPFHYHAPFYRRLAKHPQMDLSVFFCTNDTVRGVDVKKMYRSSGLIAPDDELLAGYPSTIMPNYSPHPSYLNWPFGLMNFGIWRIIKRGRFDAVILQSWTNVTWWVAFVACRRFGVPVLFMTDSNIAQERFKSPSKLALKRLLLRDWLFSRASGFLTSGRANEEFYRAYGVPQEKMVRHPFSFGYDHLLEEARRVAPQREQIRASLGLAPGELVFAFIGRLSQEKRPLDLLQAYHRVQAPAKRLLIVGDGPLRGDLERAIAQQQIPGTVLTGFQPRERLWPYYAAADVLVLSSGAETWGIVVNEAMCFGLPIIASDQVGAAVDLVDEGRNGFVYPAKDVAKLTTAMDRFAGLTLEQRAGFREHSLARIMEWLRIDAAENLLGLLRTIHEGRAGAPAGRRASEPVPHTETVA